MKKYDSHLTGFLMRTYELGVKHPLVALAVVLAVQTVFLFGSRELWFSDEIRYADVLTHLLRDNKWLVMYLNGEYYPDKPPVYFWLLAVLKQFVGSQGPALFFVGAAVTGLGYVYATYALCRKVLGAGKEISFVAGLVLLSTFYFVGLCHYTRMDLLFGTLILGSHICLYSAWQKEQAPLLTSLGFGLAALATLTKGPLGLAFPLVSSLCFLFWTGRAKRFKRKDVLVGACVAGGLLLLWLLGVLLVEDSSYLANIFHDQIYKRAVNTWHHEQAFYHYLLTFPAAWLPWTLLLFVLPLRQLFSRAFWDDIWQGRKLAHPGVTYVWVMLLSGFVLLSAVSIKIVIYLLPLFAPLACITASYVVSLGAARSRKFFAIVAGLWAFVCVALPFVNLFHPWPITIKGTFLCSLLGLGITYVFIKYVPRDKVRAGVAFFVVSLSLWLQPVGLIAVPSLDAIMSPKAQAEMMKEYIEKGYFPLAYKVYSGTYTYYAGQNILETADLEKVSEVVEETPKVVLAMRRKYWDRWENKPQGLHVVHEQWIADRPFVLLVKDAS